MGYGRFAGSQALGHRRRKWKGRGVRRGGIHGQAGEGDRSSVLLVIGCG